jgi:hypothetical protein
LRNIFVAILLVNPFETKIEGNRVPSPMLAGEGGAKRRMRVAAIPALLTPTLCGKDWRGDSAAACSMTLRLPPEGKFLVPF